MKEFSEKGIRHRLDTISDINKITVELLIENIDLAFKEWRTNPWSKAYNFEVFKQYILPYRSTTEPLQNWRDDYKWFYEDIRADHRATSDPLEVCKSLLKRNMSFSVNLFRKDPVPILGPNHILFRNEGSCHEIANLNIFGLRSLGIAATFDFVPYWAASSNRHMWNTTIDSEGKHFAYDRDNFPFSTKKRIGKVLRYTYSSQPNALASLIDSNKIPSTIFNKKNVLDVTSEYVEVGEFDYTFNTITANYAYLCVFNKGSWEMTDWGPVANATCKFKKLGRNVVYLPAKALEGKLILEKNPILLKNNGSTIYLKPDFKNSFNCVLSRNNETRTEYEENNSTEINNGKKYHLLYWNGKWVYHGSSIAVNNSVNYDNIPSKALYVLVSDKPDKYERPFIINPSNNKITWY